MTHPTPGSLFTELKVAKPNYALERMSSDSPAVPKRPDHWPEDRLRGLALSDERMGRLLRNREVALRFPHHPLPRFILDTLPRATIAAHFVDFETRRLVTASDRFAEAWSRLAPAGFQAVDCGPRCTASPVRDDPRAVIRDRLANDDRSSIVIEEPGLEVVATGGALYVTYQPHAKLGFPATQLRAPANWPSWVAVYRVLAAWRRVVREAVAHRVQPAMYRPVPGKPLGAAVPGWSPLGARDNGASCLYLDASKGEPDFHCPVWVHPIPADSMEMESLRPYALQLADLVMDERPCPFTLTRLAIAEAAVSHFAHRRWFGCRLRRTSAEQAADEAAEGLPVLDPSQEAAIVDTHATPALRDDRQRAGKPRYRVHDSPSAGSPVVLETDDHEWACRVAASHVRPVDSWFSIGVSAG